MEKIIIGKKYRIINNISGHGIPMGTILTIKNIKNESTTEPRIYTNEVQSWFATNDLRAIPTKEKKEAFIITDPIFTMDRKEYIAIASNSEINNSAFEKLNFPFKSRYCKNTKEEIIFHIIETTPYGKGDCTYNEYEIAVDSKMLCIVENKNGWNNEEYGATFSTLLEAQNQFANILKKF